MVVRKVDLGPAGQTHDKKKPRPKPGLSSTDRLADQKSRWMRRRARHSSSLLVVNGHA